MSGLQTWKIRKLESTEHWRTRRLWEEVFTEDTKEFLDYYYTYKVRDNEIYVIELNGEIVSMLHLNPYQVRVGKRFASVHYIVAVATKKEYRSQGMMRRLLTGAMDEMRSRQEPFTFLMPASEAIYAPYGFSYIYEQRTGTFIGREAEESCVQFSEMTDADAAEVAFYMNQMLSEYVLVIWRDEPYCLRMLAEQRSENGGMLIARKDNQIIGIFPWAKEDSYEIREPLFEDATVFLAAIRHLAGDASVTVSGFGDQKKPLIMAKVLDENAFYDFFGRDDFEKDGKIFINEVV